MASKPCGPRSGGPRSGGPRGNSAVLPRGYLVCCGRKGVYCKLLRIRQPCYLPRPGGPEYAHLGVPSPPLQLAPPGPSRPLAPPGPRWKTPCPCRRRRPDGYCRTCSRGRPRTTALSGWRPRCTARSPAAPSPSDTVRGVDRRGAPWPVLQRNRRPRGGHAAPGDVGLQNEARAGVLGLHGLGRNHRSPRTSSPRTSAGGSRPNARRRPRRRSWRPRSAAKPRSRTGPRA